jgi:hypothetical protein
MGHRNSKLRAFVGGSMCVLLTVTALLIWGRLKLVTGVPRTAYAEPEAAQLDPQRETPPQPE